MTSDFLKLDGSKLNWGSTSADYAQFRPGPPLSFYRHLEILGLGLPGQRNLDLGTGSLARQME